MGKVDGLIFPEANEPEGKESEEMSKTLEETAEKEFDSSAKRFRGESESEENEEEKAEKNDIDRENETAGKFKCDLCDVYITHKWNMMRHKVRVHGVGNKESRSPMTLSNAKDSSMEMEESNPKIYACDQCSFTSAHPTSIKRHIQAKHEGIRHKC